MNLLSLTCVARRAQPYALWDSYVRGSPIITRALVPSEQPQDTPLSRQLTRHNYRLGVNVNAPSLLIAPVDLSFKLGLYQSPIKWWGLVATLSGLLWGLHTAPTAAHSTPISCFQHQQCNHISLSSLIFIWYHHAATLRSFPWSCAQYRTTQGQQRRRLPWWS